MIASLLLLCAGCATQPVQRGPSVVQMFDGIQPATNEIAILRIAPPVMIRLVDAKPVPEPKGPLSSLSDSHEIHLLPGEHRIRVHSSSYGPGTLIWSDDHTTNFVAKAGSEYRVKLGYHDPRSPSHAGGITMHTTYLSNGSIAGTLIAAIQNSSNKHSNSMSATFWIEDVTADGIGPTPTRPRADKATVPKEVRGNVRRLIEWLYSNDPDTRAAAAGDLGELGRKASPAVSFLIDIVADNSSKFRVQRKWLDQSELQSVGSVAAAALRKITGQPFGQDEKAWRDWYQQPVQNAPAGPTGK